ncbi:MAG: hypothetical protein V1835_00060 [Candidatus Micrarchaeota archaeon]
MAMRLILAFVVLILLLLFSYDLYNYGIDVKRTPILMTNPLLIMKANYQISHDNTPARQFCPEINRFRETSIYEEYSEIPVSEWNKCIEHVAPTESLKETCLAAEHEAQSLFDEINAQNELILGLEKYGVQFLPRTASQRISDFADGNQCTLAVREFADSRRISIGFTPSKVLNLENFGEGASEIDVNKLVSISKEGITADTKFDYRISSIFIISGLFIFLILVYTVFNQLRQGGNSEE